MSDNKRYIYLILLLLFSALVLVPAAGAADTAPGKPNGKSTLYITDKIPITLRSGKTNEHRIIRSLYSGAKLQILETDDTHARVKTEDGAIGWVLKQYLTEEPAARFILPSIQEKLAKIQEEHTELKKQFKELSKEKNELAKTAAKYEQLETAHKTLVAETAHLRKISAESTQIFQENQTLARNGTSLQAQRDMLLSEIKELREGNDKLWFLTGAGVIFIGIVIGAMLARTRKTRGSSWSTSSTDSLLLR